MKKIIAIFSMLAMALSACSGSAQPQSPLSAVITSPADGAELASGSSIVIAGKIAGAGVKSAQVLADGTTIATVASPNEAGEFVINQTWSTALANAHAIQIKGLNEKGEMLTQAQSLFKIIPPTPTPAPIPTATPVVPTPLPANLITPTPKPSPVLTVTNDFANIRQSPDATSALLGRVDKGQTANVLGKSEDGKWWFIQWTGTPGKGWILGELASVLGDAASIPVLKADGTATGNATSAPPATAAVAAPTIAPTAAQPTAAPVITSSASGPQVVVTNAFVNVRSGPGTAYSQIGQLSQNQTAPVKGKSADGQWWQIAFQGGTGGLGWVINTYVRFEGDAASVPVTQVAPPLGGTVTPTQTGQINQQGLVYVNMPTNAAQSGNAGQVLLALYNEARAEARLSPLSYSPVLAQSAQEHADDLAKTGVGSHAGSDGSDPRARMVRAGYTGSYMAENWAWAKSAEYAFDMWFTQEFPDGIHRKTILSPNYKEVGIGIGASRGGYFFIANFGG